MKNNGWVVGVAATMLFSAGTSWAVDDNHAMPVRDDNAQFLQNQKRETAKVLAETDRDIWKFEQRYGVAVVSPEGMADWAPEICESARKLIVENLTKIAIEIESADELKAFRGKRNLSEVEQIQILRAEKLGWIFFEDDPGFFSTRSMYFSGDNTPENPGKELRIFLGRSTKLSSFKKVEGTVAGAFRRTKSDIKSGMTATRGTFGPY